MVGKTRDILTQIYAKHLTTIGQINFTFREIEVIACLIHTRGIKKIALRMNISPKTVGTHMRNISLKINCNSQDGIIKFIESSRKLEIIKEFYTNSIHPNGLPIGDETSAPAIPTHLFQDDVADLATEPASIEKNLNNLVSRAHPKFSKKTYVFAFLAFLILFLLIFIPYQFQNDNIKSELPVRIDLIVPADAVLLQRSNLMAQIDQKFDEQSVIQSVALIGPGGAGKTTTARQYAGQQKASITWEINAETISNLCESFENLAHALSKTEEDQKMLKAIRGIKNSPEREGKILEFAKKGLKLDSNWLLIYDNVENFSDIQKYFPQDPNTWGEGKVILTTRNTNVQNNKHVKNVVFVETLNDQEKLDLFTKIMSSDHKTSIVSSQAETNKKFLKAIPSFPLDVSIAAYYLKTTKISCENYLENLKRFDRIFLETQENILNDSGEYIKTRYSIIALSVKKLINKNKDFKDLFILTNLLGTQNIPRELLEKYKGKNIVDSYIYHLNKYSLVCNELNSSPIEATFSIHRSTQTMSLLYLMQKLKLDDYDTEIQSMAETFKKYILEIMEKKNYKEVEYLISHCKAFLSHNLLNVRSREAIKRRLGHIYTYLGYHTKAQQVFQESLEGLKQSEIKNYEEIFRTLVFLGDSYRALGHYEKAKNLLEQNLTLYRQHIPENHLCIPQTLFHLGNVYRELGHYQKAKIFLEQSLIAYEKYHPEKHLLTAWALVYLGTVHRQIGNYEKSKIFLEKGFLNYQKYVPEDHLYLIGPLIFLGSLYEDLGEYEKAKTLLERCKNIQEKGHSKNYIYAAWIGMHLASVYRKLGKHEKARVLLQKSLVLYQKNLPENNLYINLVLMHLGNTYKDLSYYTKAKCFLEKALIFSEEYFGKKHIETARILNSLGQVYLHEGQTEKSEHFLIKAFKIFEQSKHPEVCAVLEDLALVYLKKSEQAQNEYQLFQIKNFKNKTISYLNQALEVAITHFPPDSPHIIRIKSKLKNLE